ncbi:MAG TPA: MlaD family protein [Thermoanaerobaculia bacterium]
MSQLVKVGLFATVCMVVLAVLIWKIEDLNPFSQGGQHLAAVFDSVAGLDDKAAVRIAGVRVGKVDGIGLEGNGRRAKVTLALDKPIPLTEGTTARIANLGLLGDKYVELVPGPTSAPKLKDDAVLAGKTPVSFDDALAKLDNIGDSIQQVTGGLGGANLGHSVQDLIASAQATSQQLHDLIAENRANVAATLRNTDAASETLKTQLPIIAMQTQQTIDLVRAMLEENRGNLSASMQNARVVTDKLQTSVDNLNDITGKISKGEGTVGKLVNSDEAYNSVVKTLDSIKGGVDNLSGTLGAIQRFKLELNLDAYKLSKSSLTDPLLAQNSRTSFGVTIDPSDNLHLYRVGISAVPDGQLKRQQQRFTITNPDGTTTTSTVDTLTRQDNYVFTALLGFKAPYDMRFWGGLIEGRGGVEAEYLWRRYNLWFAVDAFDFNREDDKNAHLRLLAKWQFHPNLYLQGGYDDVLEKRRSLFVGGGIRWTDDNLKYLLGSLPKF